MGDRAAGLLSLLPRLDSDSADAAFRVWKFVSARECPITTKGTRSNPSLHLHGLVAGKLVFVSTIWRDDRSRSFALNSGRGLGLVADIAVHGVATWQPQSQVTLLLSHAVVTHAAVFATQPRAGVAAGAEA